MLIVNAKIVTMERENFENGYLKTDGSRIAAVGDMAALTEIPADAIDLSGMTLYPGFVDAHCHLGMWEDGLGAEGDDGNEESDPVTPQLSALDAVNPQDNCFAEALDAGVTTVVTGPGSANPISGSWIALKTYGRRIDEMVRAPRCGMKFSLGENPKSVYGEKGHAPVTRMATAALIREQLYKAKRYMEDAARAAADAEFDPPEYDGKCEALMPVLRREMKAFFHAHRADDLFTAIRIAKEFDLDYVLVHATDGRAIADLLAAEGAPCIVGPVLCDRSKPELRTHSIETAGALCKSGVLTALCTDHPVVPIQYLPLSAGLSVRGGMAREDALRAITIDAARICGLDDQIGSLRVGKAADFVAFDGDPFSVYATPALVAVDGVLVRKEGERYARA